MKHEPLTPHLIGVGRLGVGLDNIDVEAASKSGPL